MTTKNYYEFFAGGGMARAGLGPTWSCLFANDFDRKKAAAYEANWGDQTLRIEDVAKLRPDDLPGVAGLAWASFPCQDLSLAGAGTGLRGERSGAFWPFVHLVNALAKEGRAPSVIALENVCGALTSHGGRDFAAIGDALVDSGYRFGALVIDAVRFVPQSRPRLFIIAVHNSHYIPSELMLQGPGSWHVPGLITAYEKLAPRAKGAWIWWKLEEPASRTTVFADLIEEDPTGVAWHNASDTSRLIEMMTRLHREKVERARDAGRRMVGTIYKRTRNGVQRAEVRFDDVAGCLRTPAGGSSRQSIIIVDGTQIRSRLLSPREAARLMGLPDSYRLPPRYNDAYHLTGDGVVVPVVRHLASHIIEPILEAKQEQDGKQAA